MIENYQMKQDHYKHSYFAPARILPAEKILLLKHIFSI
jgi:hypothetical protein